MFLARSSDANGAGVVAAVEDKVETKEVEKESGEGLGSNGAAAATAAAVVIEEPPKFKDPRWVGGTWDLKQFGKDGKTDWDAVIDAGEDFSMFFFSLLFYVWDFLRCFCYSSLIYSFTYYC